MTITDESSSEIEDDSISRTSLQTVKDTLALLKASILDVLLWIRSSFVRFVFSLGVTFGILALVADGVMAGMLAVWSISTILFAGLGVAFLKAIGYS